MAEITKLIIHYLRACYWLEIATLEPLSLGADQNASVYKAESVDQKVYFVKVRRGLFSEVHIKVMSLLQESGVNEIISPIKTKDGKQVQQAGDFSLDQQWTQLGKTLKKIHEIKVPKEVQKHIRLEDFSPKWRNAVRSLYNRIEGGSDEVGTKFKEFLKGHKGVIEQLLIRAERLNKKLESQILPFVLCHSDLHAGNLLLERKTFFTSSTGMIRSWRLKNVT